MIRFVTIVRAEEADYDDRQYCKHKHIRGFAGAGVPLRYISRYLRVEVQLFASMRASSPRRDVICAPHFKRHARAPLAKGLGWCRRGWRRSRGRDWGDFHPPPPFLPHQHPNNQTPLPS